MDAVKAGFKVFVVVDACRGIDDPPGAVQKSLDEMKSAGITLVNSVEVMNAVRR
jgi:nicotinamidase-related amidase